MNSYLYDDGSDAAYWEWYASVHGKTLDELAASGEQVEL